MDPISVVIVIDASLSLALKCASAVKNLSDLASKYKNAKIPIMTITESLDTMHFAWTRIGMWTNRTGTVTMRIISYIIIELYGL